MELMLQMIKAAMEWPIPVNRCISADAATPTGSATAGSWLQTPS